MTPATERDGSMRMSITCWSRDETVYRVKHMLKGVMACSRSHSVIGQGIMSRYNSSQCGHLDAWDKPQPTVHRREIVGVGLDRFQWFIIGTSDGSLLPS